MEFPSVLLVRTVRAGLEDEVGSWAEYLGGVTVVLEGMIRSQRSWPVGTLRWQRLEEHANPAERVSYEFRMPHAPARADGRTPLYLVTG